MRNKSLKDLAGKQSFKKNKISLPLWWTYRLWAVGGTRAPSPPWCPCVSPRAGPHTEQAFITTAEPACPWIQPCKKEDHTGLRSDSVSCSLKPRAGSQPMLTLWTTRQEPPLPKLLAQLGWLQGRRPHPRPECTPWPRWCNPTWQRHSGEAVLAKEGMVKRPCKPLSGLISPERGPECSRPLGDGEAGPGVPQASRVTTWGSR